jgi:fengycin family lipopeptide synthetase D
MNRVDIGLLGNKLEADREYWLEKLSGNPPVTGLPPDFKGPSGSTSEKSALGSEVDSETTARLLRICGQNEELVFTALVTTLKICLYKYTGSEDIVVGTTIHERHKEVASLNKALALRDRVSGTTTPKQLLQEIRRTISEAYAHQKFPYDNLPETPGISSTGRRASLFNIGITLENINDKTKLDYLKNDLTLSFTLRGGSLCGTVEYDSAVYKRETIDAFWEHYRAVLRQIVTYPETEISKINLLSQEKKRQLVIDFNSTQADYPREKTIAQLFEEQAERTPSAIAVSFEKEQLTYGELNARANQVAHYLKKLGAGRGTLVGIYLEHSLHTVAALLGVLKAGAAYVPFDPEHPKTRLAFMVRDTKMPVILAQERLVDRLPDSEAAIVCLDAGWQVIAKESDQNPRREAGPADLAYVIYTSGSTGEPKGVKIQHSALVNYIWWAKRMYLRDDKLDCPLYSSLAFDLTVTMIYLPLITGNRIIVYGQDGDENPLTRILDENKVGILKLTPSHLSLIKDRQFQQSRIKRMILGGEALETELARHVSKSFGAGLEIFNEYGPTEATVGCMIHLYDPARDDRSMIPIGKPAANAQIYVLDEQMNPVPENVPGEIFICGEGLAQGYVNRSELTNERFLNSPFLAGKKMYKTGDLARWLPEGILEYVGRNDDQVKFHGYRVELNEIRSALNQHPEIRDNAVTVARDQNGFDVMIAYYVCDQELEATNLRAFLSQSIIEETVPNIFSRIDKLPLTLNGKIDFRALPNLEQIRQSMRVTYVLPRTPTEALIADIWCEVLGLRQVGIHNNFFSLGGHSLIATQVIARMQSAFQLEVPMRLILDRPTIADLALAVTEMQIEQEADDDIASLLEEISGLSGEELERLLANENYKTANQEAK